MSINPLFSKANKRSLKENLKANVAKTYGFSFLTALSLTESIWMLYLAYRGMSLFQIGLLESIYHIFSLTFEMPTGMIADRFGRKFSRVLGRIATFSACILMIASDNFFMFTVAFLFTALGNNLESGAGDALLYDSLIEVDEENQYMKIKGRQEFFFQSAKLGSLVLGGFVATRSYELAYGITALIHFVSILQSLSFTEPSLTKEIQVHGHMADHLMESLKAIWDNRHVFRFMLFMESFGLFFTTLYFYMQNYLKSGSYTEGHIGLFLAAVSLLSLLFSMLAHRIEPLIGQKRLIQLASFAIFICLLGTAFSSVPALFFLGMAAIDGLLFVTFSGYVNQLIPSAHRATLLSFQSMLFSLMMIIVFPIIGWTTEHYGFQFSFKVLFFLSLPIMGYALLGLSKKIKNVNEN